MNEHSKKMRVVVVFDNCEVSSLLRGLRRQFILEVDNGSIEVVEQPRSYTPAALMGAALLRETQLVFRARNPPPQQSPIFHPYTRTRPRHRTPAPPSQIIVIEDGEGASGENDGNEVAPSPQTTPQEEDSAEVRSPAQEETIQASSSSSGYDTEENVLEDFLLNI